MNAFGGMFATAAGYHHQDPYSRMMVGDAAMGVHAAAAAHHAHAMHHHQVRKRIFLLMACLAKGWHPEQAWNSGRLG